MTHITNATIAFVLSTALLLTGCDEYQPPANPSSNAVQLQGGVSAKSSPLPPAQTDYVVMLVIDLSGSFSHQMADDGKAYNFALKIYDKYFRDRIGNDKDRLIVAQLSGSHRSLLWQGSPIELRHQFPSAAAFKDFLLANADPRGSVIHDGIAHALEYLTSDPSLANGNSNSAVFVLSDLLDNGANPEKSGPRVSRALADYGSKNGVVGLYYVDQDLVQPWRQTLQAAGIRDYRVECIINNNPDLPNF